MPWREVSIMQSREEFCELALKEGTNIHALCLDIPRVRSPQRQHPLCAIVVTQFGTYRRRVINTNRSRAHIIVSEELLREVDEFVGPRRRSEFFVEAAQEKIAHLKLRRAAARLGGSLADKDVPGWGSSESAASWVHSLRRESEETPRGDRETQL